MKELEQETEADRAEWKEIGEGLSEATKGVIAELDAAQRDANEALAPEPKREPISSPATNGASQNGAGRPAEPVEKPT
jgi:hypothetical protein